MPPHKIIPPLCLNAFAPAASSIDKPERVDLFSGQRVKGACNFINHDISSALAAVVAGDGSGFVAHGFASHAARICSSVMKSPYSANAKPRWCERAGILSSSQPIQAAQTLFR
jgi:hypothetical protein